uniref:Uncharacterized protein n=1 Tax=Trypanosoma vivax (strain Y486) TaxID=1055687 RepID=G0U687_TRYVY|nr:hypothetical protein, conserved in T. vivax [Trypanosoma vivax Y486]
MRGERNCVGALSLTFAKGQHAHPSRCGRTVSQAWDNATVLRRRPVKTNSESRCGTIPQLLSILIHRQRLSCDVSTRQAVCVRVLPLSGRSLLLRTAVGEATPSTGKVSVR